MRGREGRDVVDGGRLWQRLSELAEIGKHEEGGVARLSFTPEERAAKDLVSSYMREAGLAVREDAAGNLFGHREGRNSEAPAVLMGSHIDSVLNGGDFDGPLGVLGGIEVLQSMGEEGVETERPVEVVAFTDEEGARFSLGMIGSRALAGSLSGEDLRHEDREGVSVEEAMRRAGLDPVGVVEEEASATGSTVGTVGRVAARPGGINIIPGGADLSVDLRDIDEAVRDPVEGRIRERAGEAWGRRGGGLEFEELQRLPPVPCSEEIRAAVAAACEREGIRPYSLPSGAGHDGMHVAELCPMGMIFVRSRDGISHNPKEWSSREDCEAGCKVLYSTVLDLAIRK